MADRTHRTAVVVIPPPEAWEPIQAIRRRHDSQVRRWMPHVTMLYPFGPREQFGELMPPLAEACRQVEPLEVELAEFRWFRHGRNSFTMWLAPEPADGLRRLQAAIQSVVPDCDEQSAFPGGFTPHLSVGQVRDERALRRLLAYFQSAWQPLRFGVDEISLISRGDPPEDVFHVNWAIRLGG